MRGAALACLALFSACPHPATPEPATENRRVSRPGAGTIVGITVRERTSPAVVDRAFAALAASEAVYSEWQPDSLTARAAAGEPQVLDPLGVTLFALALDLHRRAGGAFDIGHRGDGWSLDGATLSARGPLDLGALLKGFLADRAADALREAGVADFAVDAGGDVVVGGAARPGGEGWPVDVVLGGQATTVTVTAALSTSSQEQQPGHVVDARTSSPANGLLGVYVTAPSGLLADGQATALLASGGSMPLLPGSCAVLLPVHGREQRVCGE